VIASVLLPVLRRGYWSRAVKGSSRRVVDEANRRYLPTIAAPAPAGNVIE